MQECECGCGNPAPLATKTDKAAGTIRGYPRRFIRGHNSRGKTWGRGRYVNNFGYVMLRMPDHPSAQQGYVREHRYVVEQALGRHLTRREHVHHINGDKTDNRLENLELIDWSKHGKMHGRPKGTPHSADYRKRQSERMKRVWQVPAVRAKATASQKQRWVRWRAERWAELQRKAEQH